MLLNQPYGPSSFAVSEAFQRGFVNPVTLAVRHPATGQFASLESALTNGNYTMSFIYHILLIILFILFCLLCYLFYVTLAIYM